VVGNYAYGGPGRVNRLRLVTAIAAAPEFASGGDRSFFGHPKGLAYLAFTEAWERFSFYGMSALLLLYMIQRLLTPEVMGGVMGLGLVRSALEAITGPLSNRAFASQINGLYSGLVYFTPLFGGLIADRLLGQRRTVMLGAVLMASGHILMAFDASFLIALSLLILGSGCLKGNISTQVGHLYPAEDESRRTRAFAIFSAAINVGAFLGPVVCAIVAQSWGWHAGFALAGALMLVALSIYVKGWAYMPPDVKRTRGAPPPPRLEPRDWRTIAMLLLISAIAVLPGVAYFQEQNVGLEFIEDSVSRSLFGWQVPTAAFVALDGLFCFTLVPPLIGIWKQQERRGREPGEQGKIAIGYLLTAFASLLMIIPAGWVDHDPAAKVSIIWPFMLYLLNAVGFLYYWPTLLALFSRAAPRGINATMMGVLFLSSFVGNVMGGALGRYWETMSHAGFFLLHAALAFGPLLVMMLMARPATRVLAPRVLASPA
jgi:POT family proton-dependent oligopeptide transporter